MGDNVTLMAAFWGAASAVSLPIGAALGLALKPSKQVTSALMAFGGGALLFALTIELFGHALHKASDHHGVVTDPKMVLITMLGAVIGGLMFEGLNQGLDKWGAFMRKRSLLSKHVETSKREDVKRLLAGLSKATLLRSLPLEETMELVGRVVRVDVAKGDVVFQEGDVGDALYFILEGQIGVSRMGSSGSEKTGSASSLATLADGDVFGEIALFSQHPRTATAQAVTDAELLRLPKAAFDEILAGSPTLQAAVGEMVGERIDSLAQSDVIAAGEAERWREQALDRLDGLGIRATDADVAHEIEEHGGHGGAALAIWLGIGLDAIPESLIIGILVVTAAAEDAAMSMAFIVGVFLANLPEALSSSVTMQRSGASTAKILGMWFSLVLLTATGAALGAVIFPANPEGTLALVILFVEGLAGGAMLTMIAETMLPEAFEQGGGTIVGLSTLAGFLAALSVKLMH